MKPAPTYTCDRCKATFEDADPAMILRVWGPGETVVRDLCGECLLHLVVWIDNG